MIAILKHSLATSIAATIEPQHAVMTWLVEYAGVLITRHRVRADGRTGYEHVRGKKASLPVCGFGEKYYTCRRKSCRIGSSSTAST